VISGILPVDKPLGWTSHDVVARVRRVAGQKAVGHAGTLDPLATGVLVLVLGRATRLSGELSGSVKAYCAEVVLGATTATDDAEGEMIPGKPAGGINREAIETAVQRLTGEIQQVPPRYAAVRKGGERLYVLARRGESVEPEPRRVTVERIDVLAWEPPRLRLRVTCGAGTYIRSLARDVGEALGTGGYLHALRRVSSGSIGGEEAVTLESLQEPEDVERGLLPPDRAVIGLPALLLSGAEERRIVTGQVIEYRGEMLGSVRLYGSSGDLVALGRALAGRIEPIRVFAGGSSADGR
jgi:tRNA pseudouridine55 synthase